MTPIQISLVQTSFGHLAADADGVARAFYTRLFELDPSLRTMFAADLATQRARLMQMLALAVQGLRNVQALLPALHALGARHAGYGVQHRHYAVVGQALIETLRQGLGEAFTAEVEAAWGAVYAALSGAMLASVATVATAASAARAAAPVATARTPTGSPA
jgi:hemoglobin-like flavoprotein